MLTSSLSFRHVYADLGRKAHSLSHATLSLNIMPVVISKVADRSSTLLDRGQVGSQESKLSPTATR